MIQWRGIPNHSSQGVFDLAHDPWLYQNNRPEFPSKDAFRKWCLEASTRHWFYSGVEAVNPGLRVQADNPPFRMHAFVADYDSAVNLDEMTQTIQKMLSPELRPRAICQTFSGGARAVWKFERPLWVDQKELHEQVLKKLAVTLKCRALAGGLDDASFKLNMFWEPGQNWRITGDLDIPSFWLTDLQISAALAVKRVKHTVDIPLDLVREEIERRFPGRLTGETFEMHSRVPLFWVPDGRPDRDAIVSEWGCYSFSTRSAKGAMSWAELLGAGFVEKFKKKRIEEACENVWFDGQGYWEFNGVGVWYMNKKDDVIQNLKVRGYSHRMESPKATSTECDQILYYVRSQKRVDFAAPLLYTQQEEVFWNGERFLNIRNKKPMMPAEEVDTSQFPWLTRFFDNFLEAHSTDIVHPKYYLLAEIQRAYRAILDGRGTSGHILIFAGPPGRGKSLFTTLVLRLIFGSASDGGKFFLSGGASFNRELAESYIWYVDDNISAATLAEHVKFSEAVKKYAATPEVLYHAKFRDARTIPWYGRIVMSCNDDPDSISAIPSLDRTIKDKLSLFQVSNWQAEFYDNVTNIKMLRKELPFFLRWLLDEFDPKAAGVMGDTERYGVKSYYHSGLVDMTQEGSHELRNVEILDLWREQYAVPTHQLSCGRYVWKGTSAELLSAMAESDSLFRIIRHLNITSFGKFMGKLAKQDWPWLIRRSSSSANTAVWWIDVPSKRAAKCSPHDITSLDVASVG